MYFSRDHHGTKKTNFPQASNSTTISFTVKLSPRFIERTALRAVWQRDGYHA